jgi:hypothetical protein
VIAWTCLPADAARRAHQAKASCLPGHTISIVRALPTPAAKHAAFRGLCLQAVALSAKVVDFRQHPCQQQFRRCRRYAGDTHAGSDRGHEGVEPSRRAGVQSRSQRGTLGEAEAQEGPMTVLIYVETSKQVGDPEHLKVFATADAAETWFEENDPEGVAFEYEVIGPPA